AGGALGLSCAAPLAAALVRYAPPGIPRLDTVRIDGAVVLFILSVACAAGVLVGLLPALHASHASAEHLASGGRATAGAGQQRMRRGCGAARVAAATRRVGP